MELTKPTYEELEKTVKTLENQVELFDKLMEISPVYIFFKDKDIRTLKLSKNYENMLGLKIEALIGKTMDDLFPSELAKNMIEDDKRVLSEGNVVEAAEELNDHIYNTIKFPIKLKDDSLILAGFTFDSTNKIKSERALKESEAKLKELNDTKNRLFSIIAHDLRGPFSSILGFSTLLSEHLDEANLETSKKYVEFINSSAKSTLNLLENLLHWANSQTGQIDFKLERINLSATVSEVREILYSTAKIKNIALHHCIDRNIEVYADQNMLKTVLRNLVSNAIKFSHIGGHVDILATDKQQYIEITVSDNGVGISEEMADKLFHTHSNQTTTGTAKEKGSGLGLIICKDFVEKQGGRIWVESKVGLGSSFKFSVPLYNPEIIKNRT